MSKNIEIKNWNEYSSEEKNILLQHWWHYYGKILYTLDECEQFDSLLEKDIDKIFIAAIGSFIIGLSSQPLIDSMRRNNIDELLSALPEMKKLEDNEMYHKVEVSLITQLVDSYNNQDFNTLINQKTAKKHK
ncbi:MAG: hypothetical protein E7157_04755 [Lactobacillales bacterium]|nr:hypothetical protein [Lactobacillales bacterium]